MKPITLLLTLTVLAVKLLAQSPQFTIVKNNPATPVKDQGQSGTCWCFSSTALVESELMFKKQPENDLSEVFTVYNLYLDKAEKYIRRRGNTRFTEGGLQQDMLYCTDTYGAMPQSAYLDLTLKNNPDTIPVLWKTGYKAILNSYLGVPPATFIYNGKSYTAKSYAAQNVAVKLSDYIGLTSFQHHPYYSTFAIEVPDNYNSNMFYNLPLDEFIKSVKAALMQGYTIAWDTDVSNMGFQQSKGYARWVTDPGQIKQYDLFAEQLPTAEIRQQLFDRQVTQDDHLMQITGLAKDGKENEYFIVKNSWGNKAGPYAGYIYISMPYFAINTISVLVNKKALPALLIAKGSN